MPINDGIINYIKNIIAHTESRNTNYKKDKNGNLIPLKNPNSSAQFKYQIIRDTFNRAAKGIKASNKYFNIDMDFNNPDHHELAMNYLVKNYYDTLRKTFKEDELTVSHFYLLHLKGDLTFVKKAMREPNTSIGNFFNGDEKKANSGVFKGLSTLGQLVDKLNNNIIERAPKDVKVSLYSPNYGNKYSISGGSKDRFDTTLINKNHPVDNMATTKNKGIDIMAGASNRIKEFVSELKKYVPSVRITQTKRGKNENYGSENSRHHEGDAVDIGIDINVEKFLKSEKGAALMHKYGLGFLHELPENKYKKVSDTASLGKTKGTAEHYHIGSDIHYNNGGYPFKTYGTNKQYLEVIKKNNLKPVYSSEKGGGNKRISNHDYNIENLKSMNTSHSLSDKRLKELGLDKLTKANDKSTRLTEDTKKAYELFKNAVSKRTNTEEEIEIIKLFGEYGWLKDEEKDGKVYGGGPLNDFIEDAETKKYKENQAKFKDYEKRFDNYTIIREGDGIKEIKILGSREFDKNFQAFGVKPSSDSIRIKGMDGTPNEQYEYIYKGPELKQLISNINSDVQENFGIKYDLNKSAYTREGNFPFGAGNIGVFLNAEFDKFNANDNRIIIGDVTGGNSLNEDNGLGLSDTNGIGAGFANIPDTYDIYLMSKSELPKYWNIIGKTNRFEELSQEQINYFKGLGITLDKNNFDRVKTSLQKRYEQYKEEEHIDNVNKKDAELFSSEQTVRNAFNYDPKKSEWKNQAFDLLGGLATSFMGIAKGNDLAKTPTEERDEFIGETFMDYTKELKKLSEIGLKPEEEAYAKRMLSESYQSGLDNIVRASGGNRNIVLGNLGRLDYQKQMGLMNLALEDAKMKREALHKYGEAAKYISEFENKKQIENNERKYKMALLNKEVGGKLAQEGFKSLIDSLNEFKNNAPGSVNDMMKYYRMKKITGAGNKEELEKLKSDTEDLERRTKIGREVQHYVNNLPQDKKVKIYSYLNEKGVALNDIDKLRESGLLNEFFSKIDEKEVKRYSPNPFSLFNKNDYKLSYPEKLETNNVENDKMESVYNPLDKKYNDLLLNKSNNPNFGMFDDNDLFRPQDEVDEEMRKQRDEYNNLY